MVLFIRCSMKESSMHGYYKSTFALGRNENALKMIGGNQYKELDRFLMEIDIDKIKDEAIDIRMDIVGETFGYVDEDINIGKISPFNEFSLQIEGYSKAVDKIRPIVYNLRYIKIVRGYEEVSVSMDEIKRSNIEVDITELGAHCMVVHGEYIIVPIVAEKNIIDIRQRIIKLPINAVEIKSVINEVLKYGAVQQLFFSYLREEKMDYMIVSALITKMYSEDSILNKYVKEVEW